MSPESCSQTQWCKPEIPATLEAQEFKANPSNLVRPPSPKISNAGVWFSSIGPDLESPPPPLPVRG